MFVNVDALAGFDVYKVADKVEFFDPGRYNAAASIQENVLFGTILRGVPQMGPSNGAYFNG